VEELARNRVPLDAEQSERAMSILGARETKTFVDTMLNPAEPGCALRAAAQQYMNSISQ